MKSAMLLAMGAWSVAFGVQAHGNLPFVRWADLQVEPAQLVAFHEAAARHAAAGVRGEPGVLALHFAADKEDPSRIRVLEIYVDEAASRTHLQAPHFLEFSSATERMVRSRRAQDAVPIVLGAKPRLPDKALVRIAEIEIDPAQLQGYKAAVTEEIEASIRAEPGVLAIYSMSLKETPNELRFLEVYADEEAYRKHIASPHFRKYVDTTKAMIRSRKLIETEPVALAAKAKSVALPP